MCPAASLSDPVGRSLLGTRHSTMSMHMPQKVQNQPDGLPKTTDFWLSTETRAGDWSNSTKRQSLAVGMRYRGRSRCIASWMSDRNYRLLQPVSAGWDVLWGAACWELSLLARLWISTPATARIRGVGLRSPVAKFLCDPHTYGCECVCSRPSRAVFFVIRCASGCSVPSVCPDEALVRCCGCRSTVPDNANSTVRNCTLYPSFTPGLRPAPPNSQGFGLHNNSAPSIP